MRKEIFIILAILLLIAGCKMVPESPEDVAKDAETEEQPAPIVKPAVVKEATYTPVETPVENLTNETAQPIELKTSGSIELQDSTALCPHLAESFQCDKYDIRRCSFKTLVGQNDFYPDIISCRDGYTYMKQDPKNKYCVVQECRPLENNGIVEAYGGPVMYAEYDYSVDNVEGGIMTNYKLLRCGEMFKEFKSSTDCREYYSTLKTR